MFNVVAYMVILPMLNVIKCISRENVETATKLN